MSQSIYEQLRAEYQGAPLDEAAAAADPIEQFRRWFDAACEAAIPMANGMTLATVDADGTPSARVVLLKHYDARGFVFYTNYESRKARALETSGTAALSLWWPAMSRQIRIEGVAARVAAAESDAYFETRPRASNLSAMASPQSEVVSGREALAASVREVEAAWADKPLVRPQGWGGYRVEPRCVEFWQGRPDRLHDRLRYQRTDGGWRVERLAP